MHREQDSKRRPRLDICLVERGLVATRARARDLIRRGLVEVAGKIETRPSVGIAADTAVRLSDAAPVHVSRGAEKLLAALQHFRFSVVGIVALDVGASTGGFTEVLLAAGAARVYAVDVGHGQLDPRLAADPRVVALEGCDARALDRSLIPDTVGAIVADVSFVSLTKALPVPLTLAGPGAWLVALIKPQFEAGRAAVGKGGIVRDAGARRRAVDLVRDWLAAQSGWRVIDAIASPIVGGSGNQEFLLGAVRDA
jgi:23S rRNA (cytidine1920-2'-O)/16S rRNA (cytidine1409-2'-O)-methyltransferase